MGSTLGPLLFGDYQGQSIYGFCIRNRNDGLGVCTSHLGTWAVRVGQVTIGIMP